MLRRRTYLVLGLWVILWFALLFVFSRLPHDEYRDEALKETMKRSSLHSLVHWRDSKPTPSVELSEQGDVSNENEDTRQMSPAKEENIVPYSRSDETIGEERRKDLEDTKAGDPSEPSAPLTERISELTNDSIVILTFDDEERTPRELRSLTGCPMKNCLFTSDREKFVDIADLILWHSDLSCTWPTIEKEVLLNGLQRRYISKNISDSMISTRQRHALMTPSGGNPYQQGKSVSFAFLNISEFIYDYKLSFLSGTDDEKFLSEKKSGKTERSLVAVYGAHGCNSSFISSVLDEMRKFVVLDSFGSCGDKKQHDSAHKKKFLKRLGKYKFVIVFEDEDSSMVTSKFFDVLTAGSVPVYLQEEKDIKADIKAVAPKPLSYVDGGEFSAVRNLADFLISLDSNTELYDSYGRWRKKGDSFRKSRCRLCAFVSGSQRNEVLAKNGEDEEEVWYPVPM